MKALLLNTFDIYGGAARAAYRLHRGLITAGVASRMLVQRKSSDDETVLGPESKTEKALNMLRPHLDSLPVQLYRRRRRTLISTALCAGNAAARLDELAPDIVHLHWICSGFFRIEALKRIRQPIVWTLHDMWAFTGGCHYNEMCEQYTVSCGSCPQLGSTRQFDLSRHIWQRKRASWQDLQMTIVCPSEWLAQCARSSSLFKHQRIVVIPNGIDIEHYKPIARRTARELLNLTQDRSYILFGAMDAASDQRKGFPFLEPALKRLASMASSKKVELLIFGASGRSNAPDFGLPTRYFGRLHDDVSLNLLYSAADVFVAPSAQDNLANTVMEAMASGTPCVAFRIGGMPDMIDHKINGYLAEPFVPSDLAQGILWCLDQEDNGRTLSGLARLKVTNTFSLNAIAQRYQSLYDDVLLRNRS